MKGKQKSYYDNGQIKFEGEYLNGKIYGKGKEYLDGGRLLYEGEYLNDRRWNGKGKKYDSYMEYRDILIFEFEYLNGEIQGKGKEYNLYGQLIFEGEYKNGKKMEKELNIIVVVK